MRLSFAVNARFTTPVRMAICPRNTKAKVGNTALIENSNFEVHFPPEPPFQGSVERAYLMPVSYTDNFDISIADFMNFD